MSSSFRPSGIFSAQWLPTDSGGALDRTALAAHLAFEKRAGIGGVLALGSTGEFPHFSPDERKAVLATMAELAAPLPVIANITDIRPRAAIELGRFAKSLGLPAVALMPPIFFPMSQDDVLAYFLHVAEAVDLPVMLYNFPELCGKRIDLATIAAFADRAPMCAIKQSGGEFAYHRDLIALGREKNYVVMSGADTRLTEVFALGAAGCTGGLVNIVPELMVEIHRCCVAGRPADAAVSAARMVELGRVIDQLAFPPNVGAGLAARGFAPGVSKSILSPVSQRLSAKIEAELRALFQKWGLALGPVSAAA
jgi:4-hydroxy-tetrahydrodipicolinate synthase